MKNYLNEFANQNIENVEDFFEFLNRNVKKNTFAYLYYTYPVSVNKTLGTKNSPSKELNPYYKRIFKHQMIEFWWDKTYREIMLKKDPNFEFVGSKTKVRPVNNVKMVMEGPNGLYLPIVPTYGNIYEPVYSVDYNIVPKEEIIRHLPPEKIDKPIVKNYLEERIAGLSAGGAIFNNPKFIFKYLGRNSERFN